MPSLKDTASAMAAAMAADQAALHTEAPQAPAVAVPACAGMDAAQASLNEEGRAKWEKCLAYIRDNVRSKELFEAWFEPLTYAGMTQGGKALNLLVPSSFFQEQLELRFLRLLATGVKRFFGDDAKLFYHFPQIGAEGAAALDAPSTVKLPSSNVGSAAHPGQDAVSNPFAAGADQAPEIDSQLNPGYTFENYCVSTSNHLASSIAKAIGDMPGQKTFSPFFVFGPTGVGKTHLIQAIGIRTKEQLGRGARVLYVTARLFESQYTTAVNEGSINDFIRFYQSIHTLIIDDIQDFAGNKKGTQNAFFQIFNHLHLNGRQLVLSSDCRPSEMHGLEERLLSRFKWGVTVELERPDRALRLAYLRRRVEQDGLDIPDEVVCYLADNITESMRELEGAMVSLLAHATVLNRDIDLRLARGVVANAVNMARRQINFEMIAQAVSDRLGVPEDLIFARRRCRDIVDARQMVMYLARKHTSLSLTAIGARLQKDHATVLHGANTIAERLGQDHEKKLRQDISAIEQTLFGRS